MWGEGNWCHVWFCTVFFNPLWQADLIMPILIHNHSNSEGNVVVSFSLKEQSSKREINQRGKAKTHKAMNNRNNIYVYKGFSFVYVHCVYFILIGGI